MAPSSSAASTNNDDLLRQGPCSQIVQLLEECQRAKGLLRQPPAKALQACVSEADLLIACVKRHPAHFHQQKQK